MSSRSLYRSFGLLLALLLFLVGLSLWSLRGLREASASSVAAYKNSLITEAVLVSLLDMETGARGFIISGDEEFLDSYERGSRNFPNYLAQARKLMRGRESQLTRLEKIEELEVLWNDSYLAPIITERRNAITDEEFLLAGRQLANERKQIVDEIRSLIRQIEEEETALLQSRTAQVEQQQKVTGLILWSGGFFSVFLAAVLSFLAAGAFKRLDVARARLENANRTLEAENERRAAAEQKLNEVVEDLRRSNSDLEQFAYVASHDLQEPLRAIAGCVQVLQRRYQGKLDDRADQFIEHAVHGAQRMQRLIHDLLAYSRVGTHGALFTPVDMEKVLASVERSLSVAVQESGGQITHDPLPNIVGDAGQLELVLQNLVGNAVKFRGETGPDVHVGYEKIDGEHTFLVADNGPGIEPQYFERIFVMFQRLHTRDRYEGTGIGLAICKKIVERHGGRIWLESTPGAGTTFFFAIPEHQEAAKENSISDSGSAVAN